MSMPRIPEEPFRPDQKQVVVDLLKSVALEETAIAHLMNAEAEKLKLLLAQSACVSFHNRQKILAQVGKQTLQLLDMIIMKEWLLLRKIEHTLDYQDSVTPIQDCDWKEEYEE